MESLSHGRDPRVNQSHYHSCLLLCFVLSIGLCFAVIPSIPFDRSDESLSKIHHAKDIIMRSSLNIALIPIGIFCLFFVRKRDVFHKKQEVFWPYRCQHCAKTTGLIPHSSREQKLHSSKDLSRMQTLRRLFDETHDDSTPAFSQNDLGIPLHPVRCRRRMYRSKSLDHVDQTSCLCSRQPLTPAHRQRGPENSLDIEQGHVNNLRAHSGYLRSDIRPNVLSKCMHNGDRNPASGQQHQSLLSTFCFFSVITLINIPISIYVDISCLAISDLVFGDHFRSVALMLEDLTYVALMFIAILFFRNFYDARFLDETKFSFPIAIVFASCVWVAATKVLHPLIEITNSGYFRGHCNLPGRVGNISHRWEVILQHFYAECAIVAAAMMWQIWSSMLQRSCLETTESTTNEITQQFQSLGPVYSFGKAYFWQGIGSNLKRINAVRKSTSPSSTAEERQPLLQRVRSRKCQELPVNVSITVGFLIILCITYFALCQVIEYGDIGLPHTFHSNDDITRTYLNWSLYIVFHVPLFALYRYRLFLTDSLNTFRPRSTLSLVSGLIRGHDIIIFTSCVGIFILNIFRFVSAIGILFNVARPPENTVLASFALVFAIFQTYSAWVMTSFLTVVQRQEVRYKAEVKWTLICLIYTAILNATQWLIDSFEVGTWIELTTFFGQTQGKVIGTLLEPVVSLYGIHSAMIAYEAYGMVRSDFLSKTENVEKENS